MTRLSIFFIFITWHLRVKYFQFMVSQRMKILLRPLQGTLQRLTMSENCLLSTLFNSLFVYHHSLTEGSLHALSPPRIADSTIGNEWFRPIQMTKILCYISYDTQFWFLLGAHSVFESTGQSLRSTHNTATLTTFYSIWLNNVPCGLSSWCFRCLCLYLSKPTGNHR